MGNTKAQVAPIEIAGEIVDGIRKADGEYGISKSQFCTVFGIIKNNFARDLKPVLEKLPGIIKIPVEARSHRVDFIPMETLGILISHLARRGCQSINMKTKTTEAKNMTPTQIQEISNLPIKELKAIAKKWMAYPSGDQRKKINWIDAIVDAVSDHEKKAAG